jgi:hypothetical protein
MDDDLNNAGDLEVFYCRAATARDGRPLKTHPPSKWMMFV